MGHGFQRGGIAVKNVTSDVAPDRISDKGFLDTRDIQLDQLAGDADVQRMVIKVLQDMEAPARVQVAAFNSGIM